MNDYYCRLCDQIKKYISKYKHIKSKIHITLEDAIISRYIILNSDFDKVEEIIRNYVNIYNKKYDNYGVFCLLKLLDK